MGRSSIRQARARAALGNLRRRIHGRELRQRHRRSQRLKQALMKRKVAAARGRLGEQAEASRRRARDARRRARGASDRARRRAAAR